MPVLLQAVLGKRREVCLAVSTKKRDVARVSGKGMIYVYQTKPLWMDDFQRFLQYPDHQQSASDVCKHYPLSETNSEFTPENGWLEDFLLSFWGKPGLFLEAFAVCFRSRGTCSNSKVSPSDTSVLSASL